MPLSVHDMRPLSEREAEVYVASTCFKTGPPRSVGIEIERLVYDAEHPHLPVPAGRVEAALAPIGDQSLGGARSTLEPGGQVELSSACHPTLPSLISAT